MTHLSHKDVEDILQISGLANECITENLFPAVMFEKMSGIFDSRSAVFYSMGDDLKNNALWGGFGYNLDPHYVKQYQDYYNRFDPCFAGLTRKVQSKQPPIASTIEAIDNEHSYINTEYYQDFLRPQGIHSSIIFGVGDQQGTLGLFGFQRSKNKEHYSAADYLKARLFASQIASSLRLRQLNLDRVRSSSVIRRLMSHASIDHYLVMDQDFRLIDSAGDVAKFLGFQHNKIISTEDNMFSLKKYLPDQVQNYIKQLNSDKGHINGGSDSINVFDNKINRTIIRVDLLDVDVQRLLILLIFFNEDSSIICEARLKDFALTRRECEIVHQVSRGLTTMQIAEYLHISTKTVEHHLSHIYKKTGTHSRTALIRRLSNYGV